MYGIIATVPYLKGNAPYHKNLQSWIDELISLSYTVPSGYELNKLNLLINTLVAAGIWDYLDNFFMSAFNSSSYSDCSRVCIKSRVEATASNVSYGIKGWTAISSASYIDLGVNLSTSASYFSPNSGGFAVLVHQSENGSKLLEGEGNLVINGNASTHKIQSTANAFGSIDLSGTGLKTIGRTSSVQIVGINSAGTLQTATQTKNSTYNGNLYAFRNPVGFGAANSSGISCIIVGTGYSESQHYMLRSALNTYLTDIGLTAYA